MLTNKKMRSPITSVIGRTGLYAVGGLIITGVIGVGAVTLAGAGYGIYSMLDREFNIGIHGDIP